MPATCGKCRGAGYVGFSDALRIGSAFVLPGSEWITHQPFPNSRCADDGDNQAAEYCTSLHFDGFTFAHPTSSVERPLTGEGLSTATGSSWPVASPNAGYLAARAVVQIGNLTLQIVEWLPTVEADPKATATNGRSREAQFRKTNHR
jgi:hypothetical protein